jgi:two-component system sensor histidine kinase/response regulator
MSERLITVLLIEDNPGDARLIRETLEDETSARFKLELAEDLGSGLERLSEGGIDVALLDLSLPDSHGLETLHQAHAHAPDVPIVVLTGLNDDAAAAEALKSGGQDYLNKGLLNYCILHLSIERAIERKRSERPSPRDEESIVPEGIARDRFLADAGRALHEPLTLVMATLSGLMDGPATLADLLPNLAVIRRHVEREARLIDDLMAYSAIGIRGAGSRSIDCQAALDGALTDLKASIDETGAVITHGLLPSLRADAAEMGQLLRNLIENAIKFRGDATPQIEVTARQDGAEWLFSVRDNGIGFDPERADEIFVGFRRLHDWDRYPGTGLGLAICKKIVARHGGRIRAESEPGRGSCFSFTFPAE